MSISALQSCESTNVHLVAVTSSGVRFYLSCVSSFKAAAEVTPSARPVTLQLVHVRLPPGFAANAAPQRPHQVHAALYAQGTLLLSTATGSDNDLLWTLSNSLLPATPSLATTNLSETQSTIPLDGRTWALCQVPSTADLPSKIPSAPEPPLVVTQHTIRPKKFIFLTTQCCHVLTQLRPVDLLRQLLLDAGGPDSTSLRAFFQVLRPDQACATALILACADNCVQDSQLVDWATQALLLHGDQVATGNAASQMLQTSPLTSPIVGQRQQHQQYATTFTSPIANFHPGAISTPQLQSYSPLEATSEVQYSGKHNGLYLYLGRILKPIWMLPLARQVSVGKVQLLDSAVTSDQLLPIIRQMNALHLFVDKNIQQQQFARQQQDAVRNSGFHTPTGETPVLHKNHSQVLMNFYYYYCYFFTNYLHCRQQYLFIDVCYYRFV